MEIGRLDPLHKRKPNIVSRLRITLAVVALIGTVAFTGCQTSKTSVASKDSSLATGSPSAATSLDDALVIAVVKNGILTDYNTTTVGKAFEGTFQNPHWTSFETPKGAMVVEFTGTVSPNALRAVNLSAEKAKREACIEQLGLKDKMEREAKAAGESATAFYKAHPDLATGKNWEVEVENLKRVQSNHISMSTLKEGTS
jgi:hypothetical protein